MSKVYFLRTKLEVLLLFKRPIRSINLIDLLVLESTFLKTLRREQIWLDLLERKKAGWATKYQLHDTTDAQETALIALTLDVRIRVCWAETEVSQCPLWGAKGFSAQGGNPGHRWSTGADGCVWVMKWVNTQEWFIHIQLYPSKERPWAPPQPCIWARIINHEVPRTPKRC